MVFSHFSKEHVLNLKELEKGNKQKKKTAEYTEPKVAKEKKAYGRVADNTQRTLHSR